MNKELRIKNKRINHLQKVILYSIFFILYSLFFAITAIAVTNIDSVDKWAWNEELGWINLYSSDTVNVTDNKLTGFAVLEDNGDEISFDCATSPKGDICTTQSDYFVRNDGGGNLDGWAWNDTIGWISFCGGQGDPNFCPDNNTNGVNVNYQVSVDPDTKEFEGWAWNDIVGWISFNCSNNHGSGGICGTLDYKAVTSWISPRPVSGWLISNTFDTGFTEGVGYNSIMWLGSIQYQTNSVKFQLATSSCANGGANQAECDDTGTSYWGGAKTSGDGAFVGNDGTSSSFYGPSLPGVPILTYTHHTNKQYYRYKVFLDKGDGTLLSPIVEDVIINYSR